MRIYVTQAVEKRFDEECKSLKLKRIALRDIGGAKGRLRRRPSLTGAAASTRLTDVLSEGEQTALGLAGYFTEVEFDDTRSALVLDDPVSSLDHIRRDHVASRLAAFARDRQVIVFTHDVALVAALHKAAAASGVGLAERTIACRGDEAPGIITDVHPWKARTTGARLGELEGGLSRIKADRTNWDQDTYETKCADWAGRLSETWESIIDVEVTGRVFDRGALEVRPRMFRLLACITLDDDRQFQESYGKCSQWAHRHNKSAEIGYVAPEPEELEAELKLAKEWLKRMKAYSK